MGTKPPCLVLSLLLRSVNPLELHKYRVISFAAVLGLVMRGDAVGSRARNRKIRQEGWLKENQALHHFFKIHMNTIAHP